MDSYKVVLSPSSKWTRVLVSHGPDELLRAILPPPSQVRHERAVATLLEGLSLWLDSTLPVVLSVDVEQGGCCLGLTDELGVGVRSVFYRVEVAERGRRRRGTRIGGVGAFADLRQLRLVPDGDGR
jgi:hypothetical protein